MIIINNICNTIDYRDTIHNKICNTKQKVVYNLSSNIKKVSRSYQCMPRSFFSAMLKITLGDFPGIFYRYFAILFLDNNNAGIFSTEISQFFIILY